MNDVFTFLEKLVTDFNVRRLLVVLVIMLLVSGSAFFYESYTGHFRLQRIEKSLKITNDLYDLEIKASKTKSDILDKSRKSIGEDLRGFVSPDDTTIEFPRWISKGFAAMVPWLFAYLLMLISNAISPRDTTIGILVISSPFIVGGALLPDFHYSWINYFVYPIVSCVVVMVSLAIYGNRSKSP